MTPLSRWKLTTEEEKKVVNVLVSQLAKITNEKEMVVTLEMLLSKTERLMVGKRIFALVLIEQGLTNSEIAKRLHFTRATVDRLRTNYEHLGETDKPVKKLVKQFETSEVLKELLVKFLAYAIPAAFGRIPRKPIF